jgi:cation:H+ antiporter
MTGLPTPFLVAIFALSLAATLAASTIFARRLDRLGRRFAWPEALVGLLTATAADGPELSSAVIAIAHGSHAVGVGIVVGSNLFNLAAMVGGVGLMTGAVTIGRRALLLEGAVALAVACLAAGVLTRVIAAPVAVALAAGVIALYAWALGFHPRRIMSGVLAHAGRGRGTAVILLEIPAIAAITFGSLVMVHSALTLSARWGLSSALVGVGVLAMSTSAPNVLTAFRLGVAGRGDALVSEALHSNSINIIGALLLPALVVPLGQGSLAGIGTLFALTALTLALLMRRVGVDRAGGALIVAVYLVVVGVLLTSSS